MYKVKVISNPDFCGVGACGAHFAHGEAEVKSDAAAAWFKSHEGYEVEDTSDGSLENMTIAQLKAYAASIGVDLGDAKKKTEIIDAINGAGEDPDEENEEDPDEE